MSARSGIREFARLLYETDGPVDVYELHSRYQLGPATILRLIKLFKRLRLVDELDGGLIAPSPDARSLIWSRRYRLLADGERPWAETDLEGLAPGAPYLPDLSKVDRAFFQAKVVD